MMAAVTFGDLADVAEQHIEAAGRYRGSVPANRGEMARQIQRLALTVARYLDEPLRRTGLVTVSGPGMTPRDRAVLELRQALLVTADSSQSLIPDDPAPDLHDPCLRHLAHAADALAAGRDLLAAHVATNPDGTQTARSVWAPVLTSRPFLTAVTAQAGHWAGHVLNWTAWLASHGCPVLTDPCGLLSHSENTFQQMTDPPGEHMALLRGIPSATPPPHKPVAEHGEPDDTLRAGIAVSAERLRAITFPMPAQAAWSRNISGPAWEHTARAGALVCHMSETALTMLHQRADESDERQAALRAAITALADTRTAWLRAVECWRLPTTDTPVRVTPVTTEADALVLRIGRLIYAHPRWTPQRSKDIGTRKLADLPPDPVMLAVLHDANNAIARMADADQNTITAALAAQRIFVPSRTVSLSYATVARRYVRIAADRSGPLLEAYKNIVQHSRLALRALDDLALSTQASSQVLALARQASALQPSEYPDRGPASDLPYRPGPVENAFRKLGTDDPGLLLRANALDKATRELLAEARDTASSSVRLAALDTPRSRGGTSAARPQTTARRQRGASPATTTRRHP